jgi:hypothetical protein
MVDPITGRRADQMSGQEAAGPGSPGPPGGNRGSGQNGTSTEPSNVPFWASGGANRGERRYAPAEFGRSTRAAPSGYPELNGISTGDSLEDTKEVKRATELPSEAVPERGHHVFPRRREISHLARDPQGPVWRRRLLIAVAVGVVFTIFTDWRVGLTLAVLAAIADAFFKSRSSAASAAEGLVSGAQRRTKKELSKLERSGFRALHIRAIPDSDQVIDHLLIGPTGVYAIDSEEWDKRLPVRTRNARQLWHGPYSQKERLEHARWEAAQASDLIGNALGQDIPVRPAMAVYGPAIPWGFATIRDVDVFSGDKLRKYLRRHRAGQGMRLDQPEIERIYTVADKVLPPKR